jgi:hypothetical protein
LRGWCGLPICRHKPYAPDHRWKRNPPRNQVNVTASSSPYSAQRQPTPEVHHRNSTTITTRDTSNVATVVVTATSHRTTTIKTRTRRTKGANAKGHSSPSLTTPSNGQTTVRLINSRITSLNNVPSVSNGSQALHIPRVKAQTAGRLTRDPNSMTITSQMADPNLA